MNYLNWNEKTINDFSEKNVDSMYENGFVFTRIGRGAMQQTRSVRIDLTRFNLTSENRRILKKTQEILGPKVIGLPLRDYDFKIGKLAKDFYDTKFEKGIMSAQKVKEILSDADKSNFNTFLIYSLSSSTNTSTDIGFVICNQTSSLLHYSYPFYDLALAPKDMGLGMMIRAIEYAKSLNLKYIYLGSLQRPSDTYKLQFEGLEWFDGKIWNTDLEEAKKVLQIK